MSENIWDGFGRWDDFAKLDDVGAIKNAIFAARLWRGNFISPAQNYAFEYANEELLSSGAREAPAIVDFGCGLGRNGAMLRKHFPRAIGFDLPDMLTKLSLHSPTIVERTYSALYSSAEELVASEKFCALYDSVALQHITDVSFLSEFIGSLGANPYFKTVVSLCYSGGNRAPYLDILLNSGWTLWHTEDDPLSFEGAPHKAYIFRRW